MLSLGNHSRSPQQPPSFPVGSARSTRRANEHGAGESSQPSIGASRGFGPWMPAGPLRLNAARTVIPAREARRRPVTFGPYTRGRTNPEAERGSNLARLLWTSLHFRRGVGRGRTFDSAPCAPRDASRTAPRRFPGLGRTVRCLGCRCSARWPRGRQRCSGRSRPPRSLIRTIGRCRYHGIPGRRVAPARLGGDPVGRDSERCDLPADRRTDRGFHLQRTTWCMALPDGSPTGLNRTELLTGVPPRVSSPPRTVPRTVVDSTTAARTWDRRPSCLTFRDTFRS